MSCKVSRKRIERATRATDAEAYAVRVREEQEQDELILASIIAGAETCGREVRPTFSHDGVTGSGMGFNFEAPEGPCCAVDVGILYKGTGQVSDRACAAFADYYGVSELYAVGVSFGFENSEERLDKDSGQIPDILRGLAVGRAAFEALCLAPEAA